MPATIGLANHVAFQCLRGQARDGVGDLRHRGEHPGKVSVIVSTYNHPRWLEKVIWGFAAQTHKDFELLVADDGSGEETAATIAGCCQQTGLRIEHLWQEDRGFRKCEILNKAIVHSSHDYLVFVDGDCIPRASFLETHVRLAEPGRFLSGGIVRLPMDLSRAISKDDILTGRATDAAWLRKHGMSGSKLRLLTRSPLISRLLDSLTTTRPTFNGHNASAWKADLLRVNGFDQRMQYGGLDRELGERLVNAGVRGKQIRHRAACIHLDHSRGYENDQSWQRNQEIRQRTRRTGRGATRYGIRRVA